MDTLLKIIALFNNNKSALATRLREITGDTKLVSSHINNWIYRDKKIPAEWVRPLAESVDWQHTPHELRPDLYPHPEDGLPDHLRAVA